jgi:hypothetical protein
LSWDQRIIVAVLQLMNLFVLILGAYHENDTPRLDLTINLIVKTDRHIVFKLHDELPVIVEHAQIKFGLNSDQDCYSLRAYVLYLTQIVWCLNIF